MVCRNCFEDFVSTTFFQQFFCFILKIIRSAESNETLQNSISKLAIFVDTVGKNSKETLTKTLKWLSLLEGRWLLVLDNVDGEEVSGNIKELILGTWKHLLVQEQGADHPVP
jgi:hypothetical protein